MNLNNSEKYISNYNPDITFSFNIKSEVYSIAPISSILTPEEHLAKVREIISNGQLRFTDHDISKNDVINIDENINLNISSNELITDLVTDIEPTIIEAQVIQDVFSDTEKVNNLNLPEKKVIEEEMVDDNSENTDKVINTEPVIVDDQPLVKEEPVVKEEKTIKKPSTKNTTKPKNK